MDTTKGKNKLYLVTGVDTSNVYNFVPAAKDIKLNPPRLFLQSNDFGLNASILTLPWQYTKIVGKKNGRFVLAFNLRYFDEFTGSFVINGA